MSKFLKTLHALCLAALVLGLSRPAIADDPNPAEAQNPFKDIEARYAETVLPILESHCLKCHNEDEAKGELDLKRMNSLAVVRREPRIWQKVLFMLENAEMPPKKSRQLTAEQLEALTTWVATYLDAEAHASAGDPGRVVMRRLTNAEFDNTVRDLTGIDFRPTREFPEDSAAGEGFTNTGESMVMSPALFDKYLEAARQIASHAVLLPDGFRFSAGGARPDWAEEPLDKIREIYDIDTNLFDFREKWGQVDLTSYCEALIQHRDRIRSDDAQIDAVASEAGLNRHYLRHLSRLIGDGEEPEFLAQIQKSLRDAASLTDATGIQSEATTLANWIHTWRDQLWRIDAVGQLFNQGQQPQSPLVTSQEIRLKLEPTPGSDVVRFSLVAHEGGDGSESDHVVWKNARLEGPEGTAPIPLREVRPHLTRLNSLREHVLSQSGSYLAAIAKWSQQEEFMPIPELARQLELDEDIMHAWIHYVSLSEIGASGVEGMITAKAIHMQGHDFINGWGPSPPNVVANSSNDKEVSLPGVAPPRTVHVHPGPTGFVAVGWRSPISGTVRVEASVVDAHRNTGDGVTWALISQRGNRRESLSEGHVEESGAIQIAAIDDLPVLRGDLLSLEIGPRGAHQGDQTTVNVQITEKSDRLRSWNLAADVTEDILASNPHADRFGNAEVWHFYAEEKAKGTDPLPTGSVLTRWRNAVESGRVEEMDKLAKQTTALFTTGPDAATTEPDRQLYREVRSNASLLFKRFDYATLSKRNITPGENTESETLGLDPASFQGDGNGTLAVKAPNTFEVAIPADLAAGRTLVVTGELAETAQGRVQLEVVAGNKEATADLKPGLPILVRDSSPAQQSVETTFSGFRELFPKIMCCRSVVPGHFVNVITLQKLHREDEHLKRLMMGDEERAHLDKLWDEVYYISLDAIETLEYYPLFVEFSTQGTDTHEFIPLEPGIRKRAVTLEKLLKETEPVHLDALIEFAERAFRRPVSETEEWRLRAMYADLRAEEESHENAFRGVLARVFISPAFMYRIEEPVPGEEDGAVTDSELATRLSYFLWSTMPDDTLLTTAANAGLSEPDALVEEARRMLKDDRVRGMATEFACQWLHVRGFDSFDEKNERQYPSFAEIRDDMYEETIRFFADLFRRDGSVLEILDADHTFVNEALAKHYGVEGITGSEWQRVDNMKQISRGGVLGMATILSKQSGATRTSPVLRGNWLVETILGEKLPDPPATVPELPDALSREGLTVRQMTERHVSDESCANCHIRIDPFGFALESFDAIGRFRTKDLIDKPVDTRAKLRDGTEFAGIEGLRSYLLTERRDDFLGQFCRKLLGFAVGRSVELSDQPLIDAMVEQLIENEFRFSAAMETILRSRQFRYHRGLEATHEENI